MSTGLNKIGPARVVSDVSADDDRLRELESLYRTQFQRFLRVAIAVTGDYQQGLDGVQEGFAGAIRSRASFRGEGSLEGWVWRAVVNASRDLRTAHEVTLPDIDAEASETAQPSPELRAGVAALPERQRLVLFLRYYADLDYAGIAEALGLRVGTVSATLHAAHRTLRRTLQEVER